MEQLKMSYHYLIDTFKKINYSQIYLIGEQTASVRKDKILFKPSGRNDLPEFEISTPFDWNMDPFRDANWQAQLHMWRFLDAYIIKYEATRDSSWLARLVDTIQDWYAYYNATPPGKYVWKDMLTGLRAMKIA